MYDPSVHAEIGVQLRSHHFYDALHQRFFDLINTKIVAGEKATPFTLMTAFPPNAEVRPGLTIAKYLDQLLSQTPTTISAPSYAETIIRCYAARTAACTLEKLTRDISASSIDATDSLSSTDQRQ